MTSRAFQSPEHSSNVRSRRSLSPRHSPHRNTSSDRKRHRSRSPQRDQSESSLRDRSDPDVRRRSRSASKEPSEVGELPTDPPLPDEPVPPLPSEPVPTAVPGTQDDDGWQPVWDENAQAYYFFNRFTQVSQWENPRVPESGAPVAQPPPVRTGAAGGYNPAVHGDYDPNADYALKDGEDEQQAGGDDGDQLDGEPDYSASASFNRFTGSFTNTSLHPNRTPDAHTADAKAYRQMQSHFDVDATDAQYEGRSLKEERQQRKLSKKELQAYKAKNKARKEEKARAWLRG